MAVIVETKKTITCDMCLGQETVLDYQTQTIKETPCAIRTVKYTDEYGFIKEKDNGDLTIGKFDLCPECKAKSHSTIIGSTIDGFGEVSDYSFIEQEEKNEDN